MRREAILAVAGKGGSILATYLFYLAVARTLGPTESGYFFLSFTIVTLFATFSRAGFDVLILKNTATDSVDRFNPLPFFYKCTLISLLLSTTLSFIFYFYSEPISISVFGKPKLAETFKHLSLSIIFLSLLWLISKYFQGRRMIFEAEFFSTSSWSFSIIAIAFLAKINTSISLAYILSATTLGFCILGFISVLLAAKRNKKSKVRPARYLPTLNGFVSLWLSTFFTQLLIWSSTLIAGAFLPANDVAILNVAQRASMVTAFSLVIANAVLAPRFAALFRKSDIKGLTNLSDQSIKYSITVSSITFLVIIFFPHHIMYLFGDGFEKGSGILIVLALAQLVSVWCGSVQNMLVMTGHERAVLISTASASLVSIALTITLTKIYGLWGSAVSTALSIIAINLILSFQVKANLGFYTLFFLNRKQ